MRLIDADALMETIQDNEYELLTKHNSKGNGMFTLGIQQAVDEAPTIEPGKRGEWKQICGHKKYACADCGNIRPRGRANYCPNCGARMDG